MEKAKYIRTTIGTKFRQTKPLLLRFVKLLLFFVPEANPSYEGKIHLVTEWLIEFDENGQPYREIGICKKGEVVIAGPNGDDYGYWLDTNMKYDDFIGVPISRKLFESLWRKSQI